jgi:uncharacterized protein (TIGR00730 family)
MKRICVFCGSAPGGRPVYAEAAVALGRELARRGLGLVYGGGHVGLMGIVADAAMQAGAEVIGVIPEVLMRREVGHGAITELHVVDTMHTRKQMMADLSDGFVVMPGGIGTLEEAVEAMTWTQLGIHRKGIVFMDVDGFWSGQRGVFDHMVAEGFLREDFRPLIQFAPDAAATLDRLAAFEAPEVPKWAERAQR